MLRAATGRPANRSRSASSSLSAESPWIAADSVKTPALATLANMDDGTASASQLAGKNPDPAGTEIASCDGVARKAKDRIRTCKRREFNPRQCASTADRRDEVSGTGPGIDQPLGAEPFEGRRHGVNADANATRQLTHRRQPRTLGKPSGFDETDHALDELVPKRDGRFAHDVKHLNLADQQWP
jgi:hypothetical protein